MEPKNIKELRDQMCIVFGELKQGKITTDISKQLSNTAGKIISSVKVELENNKIMKEQNKVEYLYYERDKK